jgi:hypothetical protein
LELGAFGAWSHDLVDKANDSQEKSCHKLYGMEVKPNLTKNKYL